MHVSGLNPNGKHILLNVHFESFQCMTIPSNNSTESNSLTNWFANVVAATVRTQITVHRPGLPARRLKWHSNQCVWAPAQTVLCMCFTRSAC